jgi:RimJ/RimL family protein N-acetyltransferase
MVEVLSDTILYTFIGGEPPTLADLQDRYRHQVAGSPRDDESWLNWIIRVEEVAIGFVQATVVGDSADLAWVIGTEWQGQGYASEASAAMKSWLTARGVVHFLAHIHPNHHASAAVATSIGLRPTGQLDQEGEEIWRGEV